MLILRLKHSTFSEALFDLRASLVTCSSDRIVFVNLKIRLDPHLHDLVVVRQ
jgi:hypothetical protein